MAKAEANSPLVLAPRGSDPSLKKHLINVCEAGLIWMLLKALKPDTKPTPEEIHEFSEKYRIHAIYKAGKPNSKTSASVQPIEAILEGRAVTVWNLEILGGANSEEMIKGTTKAVALFVWKTLYSKDGGNPQQQIKDRAEKAVNSYLRVHPEFRENLKTLVKSQKVAESKGASTITLRYLGGANAEVSGRILKDDQKSYAFFLSHGDNSDLYVDIPKKGHMKVPENTSLEALKTLMEAFVPEPQAIELVGFDSSEESESFVPDFASEAVAATA